MKFFAIISESENFSEVLEKSFADTEFEKHNYSLQKCGNAWLMPTEGWTKDKLVNKIKKEDGIIKNTDDDEKLTAFVVFEIESTGVGGLYYSSFWDWVRGIEDQNG